MVPVRSEWCSSLRLSPCSLAGVVVVAYPLGAATFPNPLVAGWDSGRCRLAHESPGALLWDVDTPEGAAGQFGGTAAPLVVGDLVVTGVSGGDNGIRGFVSAYKAATGELAWKFMTIPKPGDTGPIADTWKG